MPYFEPSIQFKTLGKPGSRDHRSATHMDAHALCQLAQLFENSPRPFLTYTTANVRSPFAGCAQKL
jgi:hypothetical protein